MCLGDNKAPEERAQALRHLGRSDELQEMCDARNSHDPTCWSIFEKATDFLHRGKIDEAFATLRAEDPRYVDPLWLSRAPEWRSFQDDPRYRAIVENAKSGWFGQDREAL